MEQLDIVLMKEYMDDLYNMFKMDQSKLNEIISKFQIPEGGYEIIASGEFGESELYWVIKNKKEHARFLLVNSYWHPVLEKEIDFYRENGFNIEKVILRRPETIETTEDNLLLFLYAIFELR